MTPASRERQWLQIAVGIACMVPIVVGGYGMMFGMTAIDPHAAASGAFDSHFRYLSGLLCGIGVGYASMIQHIETQTHGFRLLTLIVFLGGLARLTAYFAGVSTSGDTTAALVMELAVTPALALWQARVAARSAV